MRKHAKRLHFFIAQWQVIDQRTILAWFAVTNLLSLLRLLMFRQFVREERERDRLIDNTWAQRAVITSLSAGFIWGIGGFFLFPEHSPVHQVFLAFVISGICAGSITTLSAINTAASGFVILASLPIIIKFNLIDSEFSLAMTQAGRFARSIIDSPAPDPTSLRPRELMNLLRLGQSVRGEDAGFLDLQAKLLTMSSVDFLDRWFESDTLKAPMAVSGIIGTYLGVRSPPWVL